MGNVRPLNIKKYAISKHKFLELYHYCLQYNEWKDELKYTTDNVKSVPITDMPKGSTTGDATSQLAIKRAELSKKCTLIEETAKEVDAELWEYIVKAVTNENVTYNYLKQIMNIPCGQTYYYEKRRKFYYLLSSKI